MPPRGARDAVVEAADRLDRALPRAFSGLSRRAARAAIAEGRVFVDGQRCRVASRPVAPGAVLRWFSPEPAPSALELPVLFEDDDLLVVDKPPGVSVNESETAARPTVIDRHRWTAPHLVHRLDRDTSGVLVLARRADVAAELSRAFAERRTDKIYDAVVVGPMEPGVETVAIGPDPRRPRARRVRADGQPATTRFRVRGREGELVRVEARPVTGRTHQIRVHAQHRGAPIFGDLAYGGVDRVRLGDEVRVAARCALHARALRVRLASRTLSFEAAPPDDLRAAMRADWDAPVEWDD